MDGQEDASGGPFICLFRYYCFVATLLPCVD